MEWWLRTLYTITGNSKLARKTGGGYSSGCKTFFQMLIIGFRGGSFQGKLAQLLDTGNHKVGGTKPGSSVLRCCIQNTVICCAKMLFKYSKANAVLFHRFITAWICPSNEKCCMVWIAKSRCYEIGLYSDVIGAYRIIGLSRHWASAHSLISFPQTRSHYMYMW